MWEHSDLEPHPQLSLSFNAFSEEEEMAKPLCSTVENVTETSGLDTSAVSLPDVVGDSEGQCCIAENVTKTSGLDPSTVSHPDVVGDSEGQSSPSLHVTPPHYRWKVRQRTCRLNKTIVSSLPGSPKYQMAVKRHLYRSFKKDLSKEQPHVTRCKRCLDRSDVETFVSKGLPHSVLKMVKYRQARQWTKLQEEAKLFQGVNVRRFCKVFNYPRKMIHMLLKGQKLTKRKPLMVNSTRKKIEQKEMDALHNFYLRDDISNEVPNRKHHKKRFLKRTLIETYRIYQEEMTAAGKRVFGFSTFQYSRPKCIRLLIQLPDQGCACQSCVNCSLKVRCLCSNGVNGVTRKLTANVTRTLCPPPETPNHQENDHSDILQYSIDCIHRRCTNCGVSQFRDVLMQNNAELFSENTDVHFMVWERVAMERKGKETKKLCRVKKKATLISAIDLFLKDIEAMSTHLFNFRFQHQEFERCKQSLQEGDVLWVCDFATNFTHVEHEEPQGAHWNRPQTTVHPIVCFFRCPDCVHIVTDEIFIASDDLTHDFHAVAAFEARVEEHLRASHISVKRIFRFSDNCAAQYKSKHVMDWLSGKQIPYQANFFCSKHGKGPSDGLAGRCTQLLARGKKNGRALFVEDATTMIDFFTNELGNIDANTDGKCSHKRRHFFAVNEVRRDVNTDVASPIVGTQKIHCIRNTGMPGIVEVRTNSCCCPACFNNEGECLNKKHVDKFVRVNIHGTHQTLRDFREVSNQLWRDANVDLSRTWNTQKPRSKRTKASRKSDLKKQKHAKAKSLASTTSQNVGARMSHSASSDQHLDETPMRAEYSEEIFSEWSQTTTDGDLHDALPTANNVQGIAGHKTGTNSPSEPSKEAFPLDTSLLYADKPGNSKCRQSCTDASHLPDASHPRLDVEENPSQGIDASLDSQSCLSFTNREKKEMFHVQNQGRARKQTTVNQRNWETMIDMNEIEPRIQPLRNVALKNKICKPCSVVLVPLKLADIPKHESGHCWTSEDLIPLALLRKRIQPAQAREGEVVNTVQQQEQKHLTSFSQEKMSEHEKSASTVDSKGLGQHTLFAKGTCEQQSELHMRSHTVSDDNVETFQEDILFHSDIQKEQCEVGMDRAAVHPEQPQEITVHTQEEHCELGMIDTAVNWEGQQENIIDTQEEQCKNGMPSADVNWEEQQENIIHSQEEQCGNGMMSADVNSRRLQENNIHTQEEQYRNGSVGPAVNCERSHEDILKGSGAHAETMEELAGLKLMKVTPHNAVDIENIAHEMQATVCTEYPNSNIQKQLSEATMQKKGEGLHCNEALPCCPLERKVRKNETPERESWLNSHSDDSEEDTPLLNIHCCARTLPAQKGCARTRSFQPSAARPLSSSPIMQVDGASDEDVPWALRSQKTFTDNSEQLVIKRSSGKGLGVFAKADLEKGSIVCEYKGKLIGEDDIPHKPRTKRFPPNVDDWTTGTGNFAFFFQTMDGKVWCIDAENSISYGARINHSIANGNLVPIVVEKKKGQPQLWFKTKRHISKGEELLYDYGEREETTVAMHPWLRV